MNLVTYYWATSVFALKTSFCPHLMCRIESVGQKKQQVASFVLPYCVPIDGFEPDVPACCLLLTVAN